MVGGRYHIETSPLICGANQWTGFYMISASDIVEKILNLEKQQKGKGIKILTPKQMLQRLPIALAQVKPGNTSENLLN